MGWWGVGVLSGDPPLDWLATFAKVIDVKSGKTEPVYGYEFTREKIERGLSKLYTSIREASDWRHAVGFQVLGFLVLRFGCEIPDTLRGEIIEAAETDPDWEAEGCFPRRDEMVRLIEALRAHEPGKVTDLGVSGLLDAIYRGEGLVQDSGSF